MSRGSQIVLGAFFLVGAVFFGWFAYYGGRDTPAGALTFYLMSSFCAVIAAACLVRRGRAVTLRIIGGVVFSCLPFMVFKAWTKRMVFAV